MQYRATSLVLSLISCNIGLPHWFYHYNRSTFLFGYCSGVWAGFKNYDRTREKQATVTIPAGKKKENAGDLGIHIGMSGPSF